MTQYLTPNLVDKNTAVEIMNEKERSESNNENDDVEYEEEEFDETVEPNTQKSNTKISDIKKLKEKLVKYGELFLDLDSKISKNNKKIKSLKKDNSIYLSKKQETNDFVKQIMEYLNYTCYKGNDGDKIKLVKLGQKKGTKYNRMKQELDKEIKNEDKVLKILSNVGINNSMLRIVRNKDNK